MSQAWKRAPTISCPKPQFKGGSTWNKSGLKEQKLEVAWKSGAKQREFEDLVKLSMVIDPESTSHCQDLVSSIDQ